MKKFNLIFLRNNKILLSKKEYSNWREIQDEYEFYVASLDFESLDDIQQFIEFDYKLSAEKAQKIISEINNSNIEIIELDF